MWILINVNLMFALKIDQNPIENQSRTETIFPLIFMMILELFCLILGRLWTAFFAAFGCFWRPLRLTLASLGSHFGPSGRHPEPFQRHGLILEVFSLTLGRLRVPF